MSGGGLKFSLLIKGDDDDDGDHGDKFSRNWKGKKIFLHLNCKK